MVALPFFLLVVVAIANRYFGGAFARLLRGSDFDRTVTGYEPTVDIVIPMFNEGAGIQDTIRSLLKQEYPAHKLSIVVVDDCSTDDSFLHARAAADGAPDRVSVLKNKHNVGKRMGIANAVRHSSAEIVVSVDSDVIVGPRAVRELVSRFVSDDVAAVGGRVNVSNPNENWLTRMQTIKYHFGYCYLKSLERAFKTVLCLSGCLTAYRRRVLLELEPILENRNVFGVPIKYGEDRFLTRQIVKAGYRTFITLDAECWTVAPNTLGKYFSQQLRWRRSNFIDYFMGLSHVWKTNPFVALHYFTLFALQIAYPIMLVEQLAFGRFWELAAFHLLVLGGMGLIYRLETRHLPREQRVDALAFLPMGALMPVTYIVFSVLALWTLDSSSWETRGHQKGGTESEASDASEPEVGAAA